MKTIVIIPLILCLTLVIGCADQAITSYSSEPESFNSISISEALSSTQQDASLNADVISGADSESEATESCCNDFNTDEVIWNEDPDVFGYMSLPMEFREFYEEHSYGLMQHVHGNPNTNNWYCVGLAFSNENSSTVDDLLKKHNFVAYEEYGLQLENTVIPKLRVGYVSSDCLVELEKLNFAICCTWLPRLEHFQELYENSPHGNDGE